MSVTKNLRGSWLASASRGIGEPRAAPPPIESYRVYIRGETDTHGQARADSRPARRVAGDDGAVQRGVRLAGFGRLPRALRQQDRASEARLLRSPPPLRA